MSKLLNHLDSDGYTVISGKTLPQIKAGLSSTPKKFGLMSVGTEDLTSLLMTIKQVGTGDGYLYTQWALDTATLSAPWGFSAVRVSSGGAGWSLGRKYYVITALNATGETAASLEVYVDILTAADSVNLAWTAVPSATSYKIYRSTSSGVYTTPALLATVAAPGVSFTDTNISLSAGAPPIANTTGGAGPNYGTPPGTFVTTPLSIGTMQPGKSAYYWVKLVVPAGVTSSSNPRSALLEPSIS